jgi:peptide/nickel transport system ATP-binding protein
MDKILSIEGLKVNYELEEETVYAVNGIDLTLYKGETLGLVGETGAGKTTTALSIMQLLPKEIGVIKQGKILFEEKNLVNSSNLFLRDIRGSRISMIFQDPMTSLNPVIPIGDQIAEVLQMHCYGNKEAIKERVKEMLDLVGISPDRSREYPHQFSGGMKQRVVIAMALACDPELLIADEPTTALDVTIQAQVLDMIDELKKKLNTSMLLITHDLGVVAQTCDKVAIMYAGEIIESGTAEDIFEGENHHPYTKGLFGSIPDINTKKKRLEPIDGLMSDPTNLPIGCNFYPRCKDRMDICKELAPEDTFFGTQIIKCHLFDKEESDE